MFFRRGLGHPLTRQSFPGVPANCPKRLSRESLEGVMHSTTYRQLLGNNPNFRRLWLGQVISELGTWFSFIAELGLVRLVSGSTWATTGLLVARLLPFPLAA